jgi:hypothetical protein
MDKTQHAETAIRELVEREKNKPPQAFPHTSQKLADWYGVSKRTAQLIMHRYLDTDGRRWFFRHNKGDHE